MFGAAGLQFQFDQRAAQRDVALGAIVIDCADVGPQRANQAQQAA